MEATLETNSARPWKFLREAIAGTTQDFTEGSLTRGIALLAVPTLLEMFMESTFGVVDAFWVAHLGADSLAAVGLSESLIVLVFTAALGLSTAAAATVARRIGEKDPDGASIAAVQAIGCGLAVALFSGLAGVGFAPQLLGLMHAEPNVIRIGTTYARVTLAGNFSIVLLFLINGVFRGSGDAAAAMRTLWLANAVNLVLDPCLIYGLGPFPALGVTGAAVATTTGRTIGVLYQFSVLLGGRGRVAIARRHLRIDWPVLRSLLRVGGTAMVQNFISTASWLTMTRINASFGSASVAGYTLSIRIVLFALMPSWGITSAAATLVGQNLGAGKPDRSERAVWVSGTYNMAFLTVVGILFFTGAHRLVGLFTDDPHVIPIAVSCLRFLSLGYPFYAWGMTMEQAFNGAGDTATPTWMNFFIYWTLQIPLAWTLAVHYSMGPKGVYVAICSAESLLAVVGMLLFRRGKWKQVKI